MCVRRMKAAYFLHPSLEVRRVRLVVLMVMGFPIVMVSQRIHRLRAGGQEARAMRVYRRAAWTLGLTVYAAMAVQEGVLLATGLLTWQTGLPLHLCSMMGLLALPMLVSRSRFLRYLSLYLGLPGAALALIFPAVLTTPWPAVTELSFFALHVGLVLAPLLPVSLGWKPSPWGAAAAGGFLLAVGMVVIAVNDRLGSNYLFVSWAVPHTPLTALSQWGIAAYRGLLAGLCALLLTLEGISIGAMNHLIEKRQL